MNFHDFSRSEYTGMADKLCPETLKFLSVIAFSLFPVKENVLNTICRRIAVPKDELMATLDMLVEKELACIHQKIFAHQQIKYELHPGLITELYIRASKLPAKELKQLDKLNTLHQYDNFSDENEATANRSFILQFLLSGKVSSTIYYEQRLWNDHNWMPLFQSWFSFEELHPLIQQLPEKLINQLFNRYYQLCANFFINCTLENNLLITCNPYLDIALKNRYQNYLILTEYIYCGNFEGAAQRIDITTNGGMLAAAFLLQAQGQFDAAITLYEKEIKNAGNGPLSNVPFYDFCYVAALIRANTEKAKKKLTQLAAKKEIYDRTNDNLVLNALIEIATNINYDKKKNTKLDISSYRRVNQVLGHYVLNHYNLVTDKTEEFTYKNYFLNTQPLKLFQFILSTDFDNYKSLHDTLKSEIDCIEILPPFKKTDLWERTLDSLISKHTSAKVASANPEVATARIIYLVNSWNNITPKLQKSKDGVKWTKGRVISLQTFSTGMDEFSDFDREMQNMVLMTKEYNGYGYPAYTYSLRSIDAFKKLAGHPFVFMEENPDIVMDIFMEAPHISILKKGANYLIESNVKDAATKDLAFIEQENNTRIRVMEMTSRQRDIIAMLTEVGKFPVAAEEKLRELIKILSSEITIHSDLITSDEEVTQVKGDSSIIIQLLPMGSEFKASMYVKPFMTNPPYCIPNQGTKTVMGEIEGIPHQAIRNFSKEKVNLNVVLDALENFLLDENNTILISDAEQCLEFLNIAHSLEQVKIEWPEGVKIKLKGSVGLNGLSVNLKKKGNWFEMIGELKFTDEHTLTLHEILENIDHSGKSRFISLGNEEYFSLSEELQKALSSIRSMSVKETKGALHISEFSAPFIHSIEEGGALLKTDSSYKKLVKRIDDAEKQTVEIPKSLQASLREYQEDGFRWMTRLNAWGSGACLADDMGLGKTIQAIAMLLKQAPEGPALIVAPASVIQNWQQELMRFAPSLNVAILNTENDRTQTIRNVADFDIIITTYGLLVSEEEELSAKQWKSIVLDEAHTIKNKETKMSKSAMKLQADFRLLLTGTPVQNHLSEIWNLFQFMNPGMLGSYEHFNKSFIIPIENNNDETKRKELKQLIAPFLLRRTKNEVLNELPGKTEIVIPVELNAKEELIYESLRKKAEEGLMNSETNTVQTLAEITRLRQAASNVTLVETKHKEQSSKLNTFFDLYGEMLENNHRALVFSQFTSHLALLRKELDKRGIEYLYLDGSTPTSERGKLVKKFQTGNQPLFLISLKAGGLGLNLTAADFVVHMDPWWNPAIEDQASDRAYRIGQKRPVTVYRLIASNTIEEKIIELHRTKKDLADSLLDGTNKSHKLSREDLLNLLRR
ncbi:MAG: SNF2-related protein [Bacteroidales bacterium]